MINNLKQGQVFKNLKELCECIGIEYKDSTNSRKAILKDLERYFLYHKEGRKIVIDEIYAEPKEKIDNRGKSEGSRNNYKGKYAEYIDVLLLQYLQEQENKNTCKIYTTNNIIAENTGIINCNYRTAFSNREKFYNVVKDKFEIETNVYCMKDAFNMIKTKIREIIKASLDRLQKAEKLSYETCYFVFANHTMKVPNKYEMEVITNAESEIIEQMGKTKKQIDNNYKLSLEFNRKVLKRVQQQCEYIDGIFQGYTIVLLEDVEVKSKQEIKELKYKLNKIVIKTLKEQPQKIVDKTKKELGIEDWFGHRSPFWKPWIFDRMSKKYIEHCYNFIEILCNIDAKDITAKIRNCNNTKMPYKNMEEQKDKIIMYMIDKELENIPF